MKNFLALLVLCIFAGSSFAAEEAATEVPSASLSDVLAMLGEKTDGKKPAKIKVTLGGLDDKGAKKSKSVSYKSHSEDALTVRYHKEDIELKWADMPAEETLGVIERFSLEAEDYVLLAKFSLSEGLDKKVKKYCSSALRKDSAVKADAKLILAALKSGTKSKKKSAGSFNGTVGWQNDGTGHYPDVDPPMKWSMTNGKENNFAWQTEMPNTSTSSPIIVGDKIFVASKHYDLLCLDKKSGKILWCRTTSHYDAATAEDRAKKPDLWNEADALAKKRDALNQKIAQAGASGAYALGTQKEQIETQIDKLLFKTNPKRYKVQWRIDGGMSNGTPTSDGEYVYMWNAMGVMSCYDFNGAKQWATFNPSIKPHQEHNYHGSPLLIGDKLIILMRGLRAYNVKTGKLVWETEPIQVGNMLWYGSQVKAQIAGKEYIIVANGDIYDPADGKLLAKSGIYSSHNNSSPVVVDGYVCLVSCAYPNQWAKKPVNWYKLPNNPNSIPKYSAPDYPFSESGYGSITGSPVCYKGIMYVVTVAGNLLAYDLVGGTEIYRESIFGPDVVVNKGRPYNTGIMSSLTIAGGNIYVIGNTGKVVIVKPGKTFEILATNESQRSISAGREGWTSNPFFEGTRMYFRAQQYFYCIGK
ncbi:MAG: PQQ-binding-like beta-propeller repeat protein [Planctomycetes bacterium]|nr:PQQ-binding-like beta-propeller repeat protein [Planctomycetota bacterium]